MKSFKFKELKWYLPYVQEEASKDEQGNEQCQSRIFWRKIYHATLSQSTFDIDMQNITIS